MRTDQKRAILGLPQYGDISEDAIRAAYWRIVGRAGSGKGIGGVDLEQVRTAKQELLLEVGVRIPKSKTGKREIQLGSNRA